MSNSKAINGSCLCGKIRLRIIKFSGDAVACHCLQCRKQTGTYVTAAATSDTDLSISGTEHLKWYAASDIARRGFCNECGSLLVWKRHGSDSTSIMAGCLETPTGLTTKCHIFTADKGDYYTIADDLPQHAQAD